MPPRAAKFAIGDDLDACVKLLLHQFGDFLVFNLGERIAADFTCGEVGASLFERSGAQIAAHGVGMQREGFAHKAFLFVVG